MEEPLVGRSEEALTVMLGVFGVKLLAARKSPLARAGRVRTEGRCIAGAAHITHEQRLRREAQVEFGLESAVVGVAFSEAVADEDNAFAGARRRDGLGADDGGRGRVERRRVRSRRALAIVRPVRCVRLVLVGL